MKSNTNRNIFIAFVHGEKGRGKGGKGAYYRGGEGGGAEAPNNGRGDSRRMELKGLLMATRKRNCIES